MMEAQQLKKILEGALLAAGKPLGLDKMENLFSEHERPERDQLMEVLAEIEQDCAERGFELKQVASGYRFQVRQELSEWVGRLWEEKPQRYSRALMETLSIIAYRQPITRGDIEKIRGVAVSTSIVQTLLEHEWVRVVGHRDVPGRPAMYATTKQFLDYFNLESLEQLPPLSEIRDLEEINRELSLDDSDDKPAGRIIEFPDPEESGEEDDVDSEAEAAAAIGTRPISEILSMADQQAGIAPESDDEDAPDGQEDMDDSEPGSPEESGGADAGDDTGATEAGPVETASADEDEAGADAGDPAASEAAEDGADDTDKPA